MSYSGCTKVLQSDEFNQLTGKVGMKLVENTPYLLCTSVGGKRCALFNSKQCDMYGKSVCKNTHVFEEV